MKKFCLLFLATILAAACAGGPDAAGAQSDDAPPADEGRESAASPSPDQEISPLVQRYLEMQQALAADQLGAAQGAASRLAQEAQGEIAQLAHKAADSGNIEDLRHTFIELSSKIIDEAGVPAALKVAVCPMADDNKGARWLQKDGPIRNPYFGAEMLECGYFSEESE